LNVAVTEAAPANAGEPISALEAIVILVIRPLQLVDETIAEIGNWEHDPRIGSGLAGDGRDGPLIWLLS
jgi:hypothetical protein